LFCHAGRVAVLAARHIKVFDMVLQIRFRATTCGFNEEDPIFSDSHDV